MLKRSLRYDPHTNPVWVSSPPQHSQKLASMVLKLVYICVGTLCWLIIIKPSSMFYYCDISGSFLKWSFFFTQRKEYRVNLKTRTCTTRQLTTPFFPFGVPPGAIFDYEVVIGAAGIPGESVTVAEFHGKGQDGSELFGTVTEPDCIPVRSGYISNSTGLVISQ